MQDNLEQSIDQIKALLAKHDYKNAFKIYEQLSNNFPFNKKVLKTKNQILKFIEKENSEKIENAILEAEKHISNKNYENAIRVLNVYIKIAPNHKKLLKTLKKSKELYKTEIKLKQEQFDKTEGKKLANSMNKTIREFLQDLIIFKRQYGENPIANNFLEKAKIFYIQKKISEKSELIKSTKFDLIENLIADLKTISDSNIQLFNLEKEIKQRKYDLQVENLQESIYEAEKNIETLLKLKKYKKAYKSCIQLLRSDNKNARVIKMLKKAKIGFNKQTREETIKLILLNIPNLKLEYQKEKQKFKKI